MFSMSLSPSTSDLPGKLTAQSQNLVFLQSAANTSVKLDIKPISTRRNFDVEYVFLFIKKNRRKEYQPQMRKILRQARKTRCRGGFDDLH